MPTKVLLFLLIPVWLPAQKISLIRHDDARKVEVQVDGQLFTAFIYPHDSVLKRPVLYPIRSAGGHYITRGFPLEPRPGERADHPHQVGCWLAYESVNGFDFWNNKKEIVDRSGYGTILNTRILKTRSGRKKATLQYSADWVGADGKGKKLLEENTTFTFRAKGKTRIIERVTTLTAASDTVFFKDVKDGFFAIRLARELEHPSDEPDIMVDSKGNITRMEKMDNSRVTGHYRNSEGTEGTAVWGARARWITLDGRIDNEAVSVTIVDHPDNPNYPAYWHARGYGLFAANPLGAAVFSNGKQTLHFRLPPGESVVFRYRLVVAPVFESEFAEF